MTDTHVERPTRTSWLRAGVILCGLLGVVALALTVAVHRAANAREPHFVIRHSIEIDAPAQTVWRALTNFDALSDWNPYLLRVEGEVAVGGRIEITILQRNWTDSMTIPVELVTLDPERELGWRGQVGTQGIHDTHHYFVLDDLGGGRTRLDHVETFQGVLAWLIHTDETREHTRVAFVAMNEALAARAVALASNQP